jgi:pimeloyl-ACP methyl ester carboxylesterase
VKTPFSQIMLLSLWLAPTAGAQTAARLELRDCPAAGIAGRVECGRLSVYENRAARAGRRIELSVMLLRATGDGAVAPDPVVYLVGGPGEAATAQAAEIARRLAALREHRDIVLVDQRGTGASHPLDCALGEAPDELLRSWLAMTVDANLVRACRAALADSADLTQYGTATAMDDLDDVRSALGARQVNLVGVSYGTRAALTYLRRHPRAVRTLTLISVLPPWEGARFGQPRYTDSALARLADACRAESRCRQAFPAFRTELDELLSRLDSSPLHVAIHHAALHGEATVTLTRPVVAGAIARMLYSSATSRYIPAMVHDLARGDADTVALVWTLTARAMDRGLDAGMHLSVGCAEDILPWPPARSDSAAAGTLLGSMGMRSLYAACGEWPRRVLEPDARAPVRSDVPALLVSGEDDPVTPPAYAEEVGAGLPQAVSVTVRGWAHAPSPPCVVAMIGEMVERGSTAGLTDRCAGQTSRLPFETAVAVPR